MENIFVDTSAFYSLVNKGESEHYRVKEFIENNTLPLLTTNFIFAETISLITKRLGKIFALKFGSGLKKSERLKIINISEEYEEEAWELFSGYKDKDFDYIDATSFVFMKRMSIKKALSLDIHYSQMNFIMLPEVKKF